MYRKQKNIVMIKVIFYLYRVGSLDYDTLVKKFESKDAFNSFYSRMLNNPCYDIVDVRYIK